MSSLPQRKSPRLHGYDYSQSGAYFVTICTHQRQHLFGRIENDEMVLNQLGVIAATMWDGIPIHYPSVDLDAFVVMPNHIHGILVITHPDDDITKLRTGHALSLQKTESNVGTRHAASAASISTLGNIIGSYKSAVTRNIRRWLQEPKLLLWQQRYHDHIIRNERGLSYIRNYVINNPQLWAQDKFYE